MVGIYRQPWAQTKYIGAYTSYNFLSFSPYSYICVRSDTSSQQKLIQVTLDIFSRGNSDVDQIVEVVREAVMSRRLSNFNFKKPSPGWWRVVQGDVEVNCLDNTLLTIMMS